MTRKTLPLADVLGHGASDKRIDILRRIGQCGSISEAARSAGVSYKAAWQALETLANLAGTPMVEKVVGGSGGGGAVVTPAGQQVLAAAEAIAQARQQVLARLAQGPGGMAAGHELAAMALRTSMRNQFPGVVAALTRQQGLVRVRLQLPDGQALHARITRESVQLLGLQAGLPVLALCKATAVVVAPVLAPEAGRNVLVGTIGRAASAAGGEAVLQLGQGVRLVGFVPAGLRLKAGQAAMASVDEAGVVVAAQGG